MMNRAFRFTFALSWAALLVAVGWLGQGTIKAVRDVLGPNRLIVPMAVQPASMAQLFFDRGAGIRAEDCANAWAAGGKLHDVAFSVPREPLRQLRLDPVLSEGQIVIGAPRLESATGRLIAQFPLSAVVALHQVGEWRREGDHWVGQTVADANDPQLTLGLGEPLRVGRPRLPWNEAGGLILAAAVVVALRRHPANRALEIAVMEKWRHRADRLVRDGWGDRTRFGFGLLLVGSVQLMELWPLHRTLDWPLWDEINYAARGAVWAREGGELGDLHSAPLYAASYGLLSQFGELAHAIFLQHYLVKLATTILLYVVLARWWRSSLAAAAAALCWGATEFQLEFPQLVYHAGWMWFLAAIATIGRYPLLGVALMAVATCVRQEYQLAVVTLVAGASWWLWKERAGWKEGFSTDGHWKRGAVLAAGVIALIGWVVAYTTFAGSGGRAWFAFQQHYAVRAVAEGQAQITNPFLEYNKVMERDFPGAESLADAWRINPAAVTHHVGYNLRRLGPELVNLARPHARKPMVWLLMGGAVIALIILKPLQCVTSKRRVSLGFIGALSGVVVVAPGLFVLAKGAYLLPLIPLCLGSIGWLLQQAGTKLEGRFIGLRWVAAGLVVVALVWGAFGPRAFVPGERAKPIAATARRLQEIWPPAGREVLLGVSASSFAHYVGDERCEGVEPVAAVSGDSGSNVSLADWLERVEPWAVLVTAEWSSMTDFPAGEFATVLTESEWTHERMPVGDLYWRKGE